MGYNVTKANSKQFKLGDVQYALACIYDIDAESYTVGIFYAVADGSWRCPVTDTYNGIIESGVTNTQIMATGSVANYLTTILPKAAAKMKLLTEVKKPDQADKGACVGYDLALDVNYDPATMTFSLNKQPPLSHAR